VALHFDEFGDLDFWSLCIWIRISELITIMLAADMLICWWALQ